MWKTQFFTVLVDKAYIKATSGNKNSSYSLTVLVGDTPLLENADVNYTTLVYQTYHAESPTPVTGQLTFVFVGSTSIKVNSIAFNEIIV